MLRIVLSFLFIGAVCATYGGGGGGYSAEYDCGGSCGGGCGQSSGSYSSPCGDGGQSAPVVQYESVSSGCGDDCGNSGGSSSGNYGASSRYSSGQSSSSGYHKSSTTITKETRNDHLKIVVGKPVVHRTTYVQQAAPIVQAPIVQYKKHRYVEQSPTYSDGGSSSSSYDCTGPCGGSKIVKYIKKTYTSGGGDVCTTCGGGESEAYTSNVEYSQPIVTHRKVTRIITQPVVTRVIKKTIISPVETSGSYYEDSGSSCSGSNCGGGSGGGYGGKRYSSGGGGGYGGGGSRAKAFAFASASAGARAGAGSGDYVGGGGSGGCKSGCDEWKK